MVLSKKNVNYVWENINFRRITSFLSKFKLGKNATNFDVKEINEYIERGANKEIPEMSKWSVALVGKNKGSLLDFGPRSIVPVGKK